MDDACSSSSGWIWVVVIIIIVIIIILLWWWAWPWGCSTCSGGNTRGISGRPKQVQTFHVTVGEKDETHPNFNRGCKSGYIIDGVQGKSLTLRAGYQYRFIVRTNGHPFYIGTSERGNGPGNTCTETIEVTGTPTESGSFPFIPTLDMPQPLYYSCSSDPYMGSSIIIVEA